MDKLNFSLTLPGSDNPLANLPRFTKTPKDKTAAFLAEKKETRKKEYHKVRLSGKNFPKREFRSEKQVESLHSQMERFLNGKALPEYEKRGKVRSIRKSGTTRTVMFEDGTSVQVPKKKMVRLFNSALRARGQKAAMKSLEVNPLTGRAKVRIGGKKQGIEQSYGSVARAKAAVRKAYAPKE